MQRTEFAPGYIDTDMVAAVPDRVLDKIIERSGPAPEVRNAAPREQRPDERYAPQPHYRKKKRESFLSELFDF